MISKRTDKKKNEKLYNNNMIANLNFELTSSVLTISIAHNPVAVIKIKFNAKQTLNLNIIIRSL